MKIELNCLNILPVREQGFLKYPVPKECFGKKDMILIISLVTQVQSARQLGREFLGSKAVRDFRNIQIAELPASHEILPEAEASERERQ